MDCAGNAAVISVGLELGLTADFPNHIFKDESSFLVDGLLGFRLLFYHFVVDEWQVGGRELVLALDSDLGQIAPVSVATIALDATIFCHSLLGPANDGKCFGAACGTIFGPLLDTTPLHGWLDSEPLLHCHSGL